MKIIDEILSSWWISLISQIALEVVISTTFGAASDENVVKMMIFLPFSFRELMRRYVHCGSRRVNNLIMSIFWVRQEFWFNCDRAIFVVNALLLAIQCTSHDDVIKWKHFPRYLPFVRGIHRPPVNSPHKGQWRGALMFSLICAWMNGCINNREAGDLRRHRAHYDVTVIYESWLSFNLLSGETDKSTQKPYTYLPSTIVTDTHTLVHKF